jgi:hypothetical protein
MRTRELDKNFGYHQPIAKPKGYLDKAIYQYRKEKNVAKENSIILEKQKKDSDNRIPYTEKEMQLIKDLCTHKSFTHLCACLVNRDPEGVYGKLRKLEYPSFKIIKNNETIKDVLTAFHMYDRYEHINCNLIKTDIYKKQVKAYRQKLPKEDLVYAKSYPENYLLRTTGLSSTVKSTLYNLGVVDELDLCVRWSDISPKLSTQYRYYLHRWMRNVVNSSNNVNSKDKKSKMTLQDLHNVLIINADLKSAMNKVLSEIETNRREAIRIANSAVAATKKEKAASISRAVKNAKAFEPRLPLHINEGLTTLPFDKTKEQPVLKQEATNTLQPVRKKPETIKATNYQTQAKNATMPEIELPSYSTVTTLQDNVLVETNKPKGKYRVTVLTQYENSIIQTTTQVEYSSLIEAQAVAKMLQQLGYNDSKVKIEYYESYKQLTLNETIGEQQ